MTSNLDGLRRILWYAEMNGNSFGMTVGRASARATLIALLCVACGCFAGIRHQSVQHESFTTRIAAPEEDVLAAVTADARDTVVYGTYQFDKDRTLTGAKPAEASPLFRTWDGLGKVFYKVAEGVLSPVGFKDSADIGTIAVRYVVQAIDEKNTLLRIDAVFVETGHRTVHPSQGTVEEAEFKAIREQMERLDTERRKAKQAEQGIEQARADAAKEREAIHPQRDHLQNGKPAAASASQELEQQVAQLRRMVQTRVRVNGTPMKAAPYKSAANLGSLNTNADVVVLIVSRYWYGVETEDGHRGWVRRDQLEEHP